MAYWAFRFDHKARHEANLFSRWSNCTSICERCMAQRPTKYSDANMHYTDFNSDAPRLWTQISHTTYVNTEWTVSPWVCMPGWTLPTCMHDLLHTVYLGFGRDLVGSVMATFIEKQVLGPGSTEDQLGRFSITMNDTFKRNKKLACHKFYCHCLIIFGVFFYCGEITSSSIPV